MKNYIGIDAFDREPEGKSNACYSVFKNNLLKKTKSSTRRGMQVAKVKYIL